MTQTRRSGIRLPWSHEDEPEDVPTTGASEGSDQAAASGEPATPEEAQAATTQQAAVPSADAGPEGTPQEPPMSAEDNELLTSLITAMREVAERERSSKIASLNTAVDEAIERMKARAADEAQQLRERADLDVAGIADWVRAEIERIEAEGRSKTDARRTQLTDQLAAHDRQSESRMEAVRSRVAAYETQLATFFAELDAISDPAVFGTAAKRMPRPPALDVPGEPPSAVSPASTTTATTTTPVAETPTEVPAASDAAPAAPEPGVETSEVAEPTQGDAPTDTAADAAASDAPPSEPETPVTAGETLRDRMDALGIEQESDTGTPDQDEPAADATDQPEAEARVSDASGLAARLAQLDARIGAAGVPEAPVTGVASPGPTGETATAIMVSGLGSFGAITSFKQALERVDGVHGISLSLGPTGEFVYRATHAAEFDLATAIEQIERGTAKIDRQADGSLRITVQRAR